MEQIVIESTLLDEWLRTAFVDGDGEAFLPCGAFDDELKAMLCISHDGVPMVRHDGHIYAPASWLAKEYPRHAEAIGTIAGKIAREMRESEARDGDTRI